MSNDGYVTPVNHGVLSATTTTGFEAAKGGLKGMAASLFSGTAIGAVLGAVGALGFGLMTGSLTTLAGLGAIGASVLGAGVAGAVIGTMAMFIPPVGMALIGIGTAIGLVKGTSKGMERVSQERGAAAMVNAQIENYRAQTMATGIPVTKFAAPNSTNEAPSLIQAGNDNIQYDGRIAGAQLAAAR
jgi:hypothetical protein